MTIAFSLRGAALGLIGGLALVSAANAAEITGAGSTAIYPVLAKWASTYQQETGVALNYQSIGSGGGIKQVESKTVTFGATDAPLSVKELDQYGLIQWPQIVIGVVPVVNIKGIGADQLTLDGKTLADIFQGKITKWSDPAITKLNPGVSLPSSPIGVVHRSDGSGTTFTFTNYLAAASSDWKTNVGVNTAIDWPAGVGGKGNEGVAGSLGQVPGSIGYVEYAYALQNKLAWVKLVNHDGKAVSPSEKAFAAAAAGADWTGAPGMGLVMTDEPGADSWPITGATFVLLHKTPDNAADAQAALKFFDWGFTKGIQQAMDLAYVPLPDKVVGVIEAAWKSNEKGSDGKALW